MGSLIDRSLDQAAFAALPASGHDRPAAPARRRRSTGWRSARRWRNRSATTSRRLRLQIVCLTAFGVGACVAICGAIGFIGLIAPIFARRLTRGHPGRAILPAALIGALLLIAADLVTRLAPLGRTLPIGVVTALIGAPFFLWLVAHMRWRLRP